MRNLHNEMKVETKSKIVKQNKKNISLLKKNNFKSKKLIKSQSIDRKKIKKSNFFILGVCLSLLLLLIITNISSADTEKNTTEKDTEDSDNNNRIPDIRIESDELIFDLSIDKSLNLSLSNQEFTFSNFSKNNSLNQVIVSFKKGISIKEENKVIQKYGGIHLNKNTILDVGVVGIEGEVQEFIDEIMEDNSIKYAEYNGVVNALYVPNDPKYQEQWALQSIKSPQVWDKEKGNNDVLIAFIDTGIDYNHEDLAYNYITCGYDFVNFDNDPWDDNGHGTHCAGIATATMDNGVGIAGVAQVDIMAEKVLDKDGSGSYWNVAQGIIHATNAGADVISLSLSGDASKIIQDACEYAWKNNVVLIGASGNDNKQGINYPAKYETVISVGAIDQNNERCNYPSKWGSNWGQELELVAPGNKILSTKPNNSYQIWDGTSMATSYVAGVAALIISYNPTLTNAQVRSRLHITASDIGPFGWDLEYGYGKVDAYKAVTEEFNMQTITIYNDGNGSLIITEIKINFQNDEPVGWLFVGSNSFTVPADESKDVYVYVSENGLEAGEYHSWLDILSNDPDENPYRVTVTLFLKEPKLSIDSISKDFGDIRKGKTVYTTFKIWNSGNGTLIYTLKECSNWIDVNPTSGSLFGDDENITISIDTINLSLGFYCHKILIESNGGIATFVVSINIKNSLPVANAGDPYSCYEGSIITFDGSASYDLESVYLKYRWDFNNDGIWDTNWSSSNQAIFVYNDDYDGFAKLEVKDENNEIDRDFTKVLIYNQNPRVNFSFPLVCEEGVPVTFSASHTDQSSNDSHYYRWDFDNDGIWDTDWMSINTTKYSYPNDGIFIIKMSVKDDDGGIDTKFKKIIVENIPPKLYSIDTLIVNEDVLFQYQIHVNDTIGDILTFSDDTDLFEINSRSGLISFTPKNEDVGEHNVNIFVIDDNNCLDYKLLTLVIKNTNDAPVINIFGDITTIEGEPFNYKVIANDIDIGDNLMFSVDSEFFEMGIKSGTLSYASDHVVKQGSYRITITVWDSNGTKDQKTLNILVLPKSGGQRDYTISIVLSISIVIICISYFLWVRQQKRSC